MLSPPRSSILKVAANKEQLNQMLSDALMEPEFYQLATAQGNTLTIAGVKDYPIEITSGVRIDRRDIKAEHEEADLIITQQAILSSVQNKKVVVVSEDTDVFAMLLHFYKINECSESMYMASPKNRSSKNQELSGERHVIDIKDTAEKHAELSKFILQVHALTGADTVPALYRIGKKKALNALSCFQVKSRKVASVFFNPEILSPIGDVTAEMNNVLEAGSQFMLACYGKAYFTTCSSVTEARVKVWRKKIAVGPVKLCELPPTNEAAAENIKRAHLQVAHWMTALSGVPPSLNPLHYGFEAQQTEKGPIFTPLPVPHGIKDAPDIVRELIHCGCEKYKCLSQSCKCSTIGCTVFCKCEAGPNCKNPLTTRTTEGEDDEGGNIVSEPATEDTT